MNGASATLDGGDTLLRALQRLRRTGGDLPMRELAQAGAEHTRLSFRTGRDPWGNRWQPLQRSTIEQRRQRSNKPLRDTGRLSGSIAADASGDEAAWGTAVEYGAIHQFGGRTRPRVIRPRRRRALFWPGAAHPVRSVNHPGSRIPARPFLPVRNGQADLPDDLQADMLDVINNRLRRAVRR